MPSNTVVPAAVFATAAWAIIIAALVQPAPTKPLDGIWVVTSSEKNRSHPALVRAAQPKIVASIDASAVR